VAAAVAQVHGPGPIGRLNAKVGLKITLIVGTMWAAYLFTLLARFSAPSAFQSGDKIHCCGGQGGLQRMLDIT
jgi:hypothetical protein